MSIDLSASIPKEGCIFVWSLVEDLRCWYGELKAIAGIDQCWSIRALRGNNALICHRIRMLKMGVNSLMHEKRLPNYIKSKLSHSNTLYVYHLKIIRMYPYGSHWPKHYSDVIMGMMASQITGVSMVCSNVCSCTDKRRHQSSASLTFAEESTGDQWIPLTKGQ